MKVPFKNARQQHHYEFCRRCGADKGSAFYLPLTGRPRVDDDPTRRWYWHGRQGRQVKGMKEPLAYAAWAAGRDDFRRLGPVLPC